MTDLDVAPEAPPRPPRPPLTTTTSLKPAATVLALAVLTLGAFGIIDLTTNQGVANPKTVVVVGGLSIDRSSTVLNPCVFPGQIPNNVLTAYIVPTSTVGVGPALDQTSDPGAYDCSRTLRAPYPQSKVLGFYLNEFRALGWSVFSRGPSVHGGGQQELFQIAGNDTFYWVSGVTITQTSATSTTWTLRFYQNDALD